jgi:UDP-N-acetyl-D-mannosaminuronate dehydrogenase
VIAVPTPLNLNHKPDLSMLKNACQIVAKVVKDDSLIINESTSYIGTLRNLIKPTIDTLSGLKNLIYAVAPERIDPGNKEWDMGNTPRLISGLTNESTQKTITTMITKLISKLITKLITKIITKTITKKNITTHITKIITKIHHDS